MLPASSSAAPYDEPLLGEEADSYLPQQKLPAWLMSAVLHVCVLLLLALTLRAAAPGVPGDEPDRTVGIAMKGTSEAETDYFEEQESSSGGAAPGAESLTQAQALPQAAEAPLNLKGALPTGEMAVAGDHGESQPGAGGMLEGPGTGNFPGDGDAIRTSVFGASGVGSKFVYVFDRSGSMDGYRGRPMAAAKAALLSSLQDLERTNQFQIIFYNEFPEEFTLPGETPRLHYGDETGKQEAERFVRGILATGGTRHMDALRLALRMHPDVIFFLTDANEPRLTNEQLAEVRRLNQGLTVIHSIEFGYGPALGGENFLRQLARDNGGQHVYVDISQLPRQ